MSAKGYTAGTHRLVDPSDTLARIRPHLTGHGITRCADVTGLDTVGIPVYCAIRPSALTVQVANGKGVRHVDAQVSALMEAIELYCAEHPTPEVLHRASLRSLSRDAVEVLEPHLLRGFQPERFFTPGYEIDWVRGDHLIEPRATWVPASAVHLCQPALHSFSSGGLASGNSVTEATLHALYELLEHDAIGRLSVHGRLDLAGTCSVLDLATIDDAVIVALGASIERAGLSLVLLTVPAHAGVTVMWAAILDPQPLANCTIINFGFGGHLSPSVAASRAITEAAQARLTFIHGSREDFTDEVYSSAAIHNRLRRYFAQLTPNRRWPDLVDRSTPTLTDDLDRVLAALCREGFDRVVRVDLTRAPSHIPVVKVLVPGLESLRF